MVWRKVVVVALAVAAVMCAEKPGKEVAKPEEVYSYPVALFRTTFTTLPNPSPNLITVKPGYVYVINSLVNSVAKMKPINIPRKTIVIAHQLAGMVVLWNSEKGGFLSSESILSLEDEWYTNVEEDKGLNPYDAVFLDYIYIVNWESGDVAIMDYEGNVKRFLGNFENPNSITRIGDYLAVVGAKYDMQTWSFANFSYIALLDLKDPLDPEDDEFVKKATISCVNAIDALEYDGKIHVICTGGNVEGEGLAPATTVVLNFELEVEGGVAVGGYSPKLIEDHVFTVDWTLGVLSYDARTLEAVHGKEEPIKLLEDVKGNINYQSTYMLDVSPDGKLYICYFEQKKVVEALPRGGDLAKTREIEVGAEPCPLGFLW